MQDPMAFIIAMGQIAAAIALLNGAFTTVGQGRVVASAIEAIARQPETSSAVSTNMFIGIAICETSGIYGLLISFILLFANPLITMYQRLAGL